MSHTVSHASGQQVKEVLKLMLAGVSSDPVSMRQLNRSWWRRLMFRYVVGPRLLGKQMDTYVVSQDGQLQGYLVVQYTGEAAGTFDWAFRRPLGEQQEEIFGELLDTALDGAEAHGHYSHFYFGLQSDAPAVVTRVLAQTGFGRLNYQNVQMVSELPLSETGSFPPDLHVTVQIRARFRSRVPELIRCDYPTVSGKVTEVKPPEGELFVDEADLDVIASIHDSTLNAAKLMLVEWEDEAVGFVQQNQWQDELRILLSLKPAFWNTPTERQLVAALPPLLGKRSQRIRVRTFNQVHLETSRPTLESLGLRWEEAPWQRWLVAL